MNGLEIFDWNYIIVTMLGFWFLSFIVLTHYYIYCRNNNKPYFEILFGDQRKGTTYEDCPKDAGVEE